MSDDGISFYVSSDRTMDNVYIPTVHVGDDVSFSLEGTASRQRYALAVMTACEYAIYDAAVLAQITRVGKGDRQAAAAFLADLRSDRPPLDDVGTLPLRFVPAVSQDFAPGLTLFVNDRRLGVFDVSMGLTHAAYVLQVGVTVDCDAAYLAFLTMTVGIPSEKAVMTVHDLGSYRYDVSTSERLARTLEMWNAPDEMADRARAGHYDDYRSPLADPIGTLVGELLALGLDDLAKRAKNGEFDGTKAEADEWANSADGRATFAQLLDGAGREQNRAARRARARGNRRRDR